MESASLSPFSPEKNASHVHSTSITTPASAASKAPSPQAPAPKARSCVVCRARKVRCDKQSPCSNCRRANIACVVPSTDRPPRWARRLDRIPKNAETTAPVSQGSEPATTQVMDRLRNLEGLVKELRSQLEEANSNANSPNSGAGNSEKGEGSPKAQESSDTIQKQFGRLVVQDANRSRYVSSGFWSRVNDELDGLRKHSHGPGPGDSDSSEDEDEFSSGKSPSTYELERTPSQRHAFLFQHNLSQAAPDAREFHPLPSQIPFLLDVFSENVNVIMRTVHIPTISKMVRGLRGSDISSLTPGNEALMFSIYYAAIASMEEEDIMTNFGFSKSDLSLKYRLGLEHALAKADFLNVPNLVLIQAFSIFLLLARLHDSPRFIWMMTGLAIRMGQALGLNRDGSQFDNLTPYEIEMRRRVWWSLVVLDVRASEDQGMDYTITQGGFDTKFPLNINDSDIHPETTEMPTSREGLSDMAVPLVQLEICETCKEMMNQTTKDGTQIIERQTRLSHELYEKVERGYLQYSEGSSNIVSWVTINVTRLVVAKMTLFVLQPVLLSSPSEPVSDEIKTKLLIASIEVAECNHALNSEPACRHWRWVYQTYTHWYAVVLLLLEVSRRPWSPIIERAWVALHSEWLIPAQSHVDKHLQIWLPLRKLTTKARKHRDAEIERLRNDPQAARQLELDDQRIPISTSPGPFPAGSDSVELFRDRWRQLVSSSQNTRIPAQSEPQATSLSAPPIYTTQPSPNPFTTGLPTFNTNSATNYLSAAAPQPNQNLSNNPSPSYPSASTTIYPNDFTIGQDEGQSYDAIPAEWSSTAGTLPWLWADVDPSVDVFANVDMDTMDINMDLNADIDWLNWVESARGMEMDGGSNGNGRT